jgi:iron complex transport system substrate-binding protein
MNRTCKGWRNGALLLLALILVGGVFSGAAGAAPPPRRVVVVGMAPFIALHLLYAFPEGPKILVGYERKYKSDESFLPLIDPDFGRKRILETNPGPEQIAALRPDLVIAKRSQDGPLARSLSAVGIPMLHLGLENPERFLADVATLGRVLGNPARAKEIISYYKERLDMLERRRASRPVALQPKVLVMEYSNRGGGVAVRVPGNSWIQTIQVRLAGGNPVWTAQGGLGGEGWQLVNLEQIAAWNPEKIFMVVWFQLDKCQVMNSLAADPNWRGLAAVTGGEFHLFPQDLYGWDTPDPRWILGALWLASRIWPDARPAIHMKREIFTFFKTLYGMDKDRVERQILPRVRLNGCP